MATARLGASARTNGGKGAARALRRDGRVPAVIYGHGREPQSLSVAARELERLLGQVSFGNTVIELEIEGQQTRTLIREIQRHPVKRNILHVDFQALVAGEHMLMRVPLVLVGVPEGVRVGGGLLDQVLHELEVEADPASLPSRIEVDVLGLQVMQVLHVGDLTLPPGVSAPGDPDRPVCTVQAPRVEEAPAEAPVGAEPEVIRKAKTEEGAE